MSKCGKGCMPECEYFTTGGCISPFNCMYKEESGYINSATSGTVIYTGGMNMTNEEMIENLKCVIADIFEQCEQLKAENAALRERLEKAVELPATVMIERTLVDGKFKDTQKAQAFNGRIGVVYRDETRWKGLLVDICSERTGDYKAAESRLAELKGEKGCAKT